MPQQSPDQFVARIYRDGAIAGAGLLLTSDLVLTCAHVAAGKAGSTAAEAPDLTVTLDVPASDRARRYAATVVDWAPLRDTPGLRDLAVLELAENLSGFTQEPPILISPALKGDLFRVIGFPRLTSGGHVSTYDDGVEATGLIGQRVPSGWIQLDAERESGYPLATGFSGAPVWNDRACAFVGLVAAADRDPKIKSGTMIPFGDFIRLSERVATAMRDGLTKRWRRWESEIRGDLTLRHALSALDAGSELNIWWRSFEDQTPWHVEVGSQINSVRKFAAALDRPGSLSDLAERLGHIDLEAAYPTIVQQLRAAPLERVSAEIASLLREERLRQPRDRTTSDDPRLTLLRQLRSSVAPLARTALEPRFRRCFLVTGTFGSGKTHFASSRLHDGRSDDSIFRPSLHVPLDASRLQASVIEAEILEAARDASGIRWQSLRELDACLHALDDNEDSRPTRVVVQIDDVHVAARADRDFVRRLTQFIDAHSSLHCLHYLLTIQDAEYDRVAAAVDFWQRQTSINPFPDRSGRHRLLDPTHIGGWIVLDEANRRNRTGLLILRRAFGGSFEEPLPFEHSPDAERLERLVAHPLTAVIVMDLEESIAPETLNFLEFVDHFWRRRKATLDPSPLTGEQFEEAVALLAGVVAELGYDFAPLRHMLPRVPAVSARLFGLPMTAEFLKEAIDVMAHASLVRLERLTPDDAVSRRLRFLFEVFWSYRIAMVLAGELRGLTEPPALVSAVEKFLGADRFTWMGETILEFLMLILAREDGVEPAIDRSLLIAGSTIESRSPLAAAPWLAGTKFDPGRQRALVEIGGQDVGDHARATFAFMYFVKSVDLAPDGRLDLLQPLYARFGEYGLSSYFVYVFETVLGEVETLQDLVKCLLAMTGSESMDVTRTLGRIASDRFLALAGKDVGLAVDAMMRRYLPPLCSGPRADRRQIEGPWERFFFREFFLRELLMRLAGEMGIALYDVLDHGGWYKASRGGIAYPIWLEMEREANIAIGSQYRVADRNRAARFIGRLRKLVEHGDLRDREVAFYIIYHTELTAGREVVRVRDEFLPLLGALAEDALLVERVARAARFRKFLSDNLGPEFNQHSRAP